ANVVAGDRMVVAQSKARPREATRSAEPPPRLRPRTLGVVPLNLAILGTRGVPPRYGGFETFAAELGTRLTARGHRVAVYCRTEGEKSWRGIERIVLPAIRHKYLETVSHAFLSTLDALHQDFDAILVCNAANAFVLPLLRAGRVPV